MKSWDGIYLTLFGRTFGIDFWREFNAYECTENEQTVFVREQSHRFLPYYRRIVHRAPDK